MSDINNVANRTMKNFAEPAFVRNDVEATETVQSNYVAPVSTPVAPVVQEVVQAVEPAKVVNTRSCFTIIDLENPAIDVYSKEYSNRMNVTDCVADPNKLLTYMVEQERAYGVALSFRSVGLDTIVFDISCTPANEEEGTPATVAITFNGEEGEEVEVFYEKITVDGDVYLSCLSEVLDPDYLHQIIAELAEALHTHGKYVYTLVGPRPLRGRTVEIEDTQCQQFIETLKLNSYELSVLIGYVKKLGNISISYDTYNGHQAIIFERR